MTSNDYRWERCDDELGLTLWRALVPLLGESCGVGESYTSDEHVITGVWAKSPEVPIVKCESFYRVSGGVRDEGRHTYSLPVPMFGDADIDAAELRGHTRAVNSTAILSIHKAVAAERAAVVAWLRDGGDACTTVGREYMRSAADEIEAGDHHPKENE